MYQLREYQIEKANEGFKILKDKKIVYITAMVRTGKTAISLQICKLHEFKNVLFLTKKKAIDSILKDYKNFGFNNLFDLVVINDESLHTIELSNFDCVIHDEHHRHGKIGTPSKGCKDFKLRFSKLPIILLSGTPTPENYSQIFHQFWVSDYSPFIEKSFYKWAKNYVNVTQKRIGQHFVNDYTNAKKELIEPLIKPYLVKLTQKEAGFSSEIKENIHEIESKALNTLITILKKERLIDNEILESKGLKLKIKGEIVADTPAKLMQKIHQISAGTCLNEDSENAFEDRTRIKYIAENFKGKKLVIFYNFKHEFKLISDYYGNQITTDISEFNTTSKHIALQLVSGREGINLSKADALVYYNISFSALTYWQSRDRMTTMERLNNEVHFITLKGGIESHILKQIQKKKNFTLSHFNQAL